MAKITVSADYNLPLIAERAGQPDADKRLYRNGELHVEGVTQAALDAALAGYDDAVDGLPDAEILEALRESEKPEILARKLEEVIDNIENGAPLSDFAKGWAAERKTERGRL